MIERVPRLAGKREGVTRWASLIFAWEIGGEDCVGGASVNVESLPVPVVHLGMDVH